MNATDIDKPIEIADPVEYLVKLPRPDGMPRVESGPIQFGNDWPGVFLRGDDAFYYATALNDLLTHDKAEPISLLAIGELWKILTHCLVT